MGTLVYFSCEDCANEASLVEAARGKIVKPKKVDWQVRIHRIGEQCIPVDMAIKSLTLWAAYQHYEESNRGSIEVGKFADFVVLDKNPHEVPIEELADLKVMQTTKAGKIIYTAPEVLE